MGKSYTKIEDQLYFAGANYQIVNFLDWKYFGLPNVHILFSVSTQNIKMFSLVLICNENKEIYVANLMIQ